MDKSPAADFSSLFEFLPIGAYRSSPQGLSLRANPALVQLNGYASEAELLAAVQDIAREWYVLPSRRAEFMALLERDGKVLGFESEVYRHKTRERIWIREHAHPVRSASGEVLYFEGTVEEITEQVRSRQALQRSQASQQQLISLLPGVVYRLAIHPDGRRHYSFVSDGVRELYCIEPEAVLADSEAMVRFRHPDDVSRMVSLSEAAMDQRLPLQAEVRAVLADGSEKWIQVLSAPAPSEDGFEVRVGLLFDITQRKRTEIALAESGELWKLALECTGDGVWDWHIADGMEVFSPALLAMYGLDPNELAKRPGALDRLTHPDDVAPMLAKREAHIAGHTPTYVSEHRIRCRDGRWKWVLSRGMVISRDAQGQALRMIGTHTDITAAKQAQALLQERDRAAASDAAKSQFLSRVSHELRTPLNAILGFAQLLELQPGVGERQQGWNRQVLASGRHLLALVDDILDLSSVQTGHVVLHTQAVALRDVLDEAWAMLAAVASSRGIGLVNNLPVDGACNVLADRKRLKQVLSNLLSNAIKYNREGGWVRLSLQREAAHLTLKVADHGRGLDAAQQARLFKPFDRLGAERGTVPGTGLGLALSHQLAQAMGASLAVDSSSDQGTVFGLRLPAA